MQSVFTFALQCEYLAPKSAMRVWRRKDMYVVVVKERDKTAKCKEFEMWNQIGWLEMACLELFTKT